jgi:hypothetical protein
MNYPIIIFGVFVSGLLLSSLFLIGSHVGDIPLLLKKCKAYVKVTFPILVFESLYRALILLHWG